jgi:carbon storage regulator
VLILSRREAESICLGEDIVLTIVSLGKDKVRIGVQAPPGVRILRTELEIQSQTLSFQTAKEAKQQSLQAQPKAA